MGNVQFGPPKNCIVFLRDAMGLTTFVEGGTYRGDTSKWAAHNFDAVFTIENSAEMFAIAKQNLIGIPNITMLHGDTRKYLPGIVAQNNNLIYWLDAHWSGGVTYGEFDECPIFDELAIIFGSDRNHVILIDDARLFLAPPPSPHQRKNWPTLLEIMRSLPAEWDCLCHDDVLAIIPPSTQEAYRDFLQHQISSAQKESNSAMPKFISRLRQKLTG